MIAGLLVGVAAGGSSALAEPEAIAAPSPDRAPGMMAEHHASCEGAHPCAPSYCCEARAVAAPASTAAAKEPLDLSWLSTLVATIGGLLALLLLREPIRGLTGRAQKISYGDWSLELSRMTDMKIEHSPISIEHLMAANIDDSGSQTIQQLVGELATARSVNFVTVNLSSVWWSSRLYLLTLLIEHVSSVRAMIFVGAPSGQVHQFLAAVGPREVRRGLERKYPWLGVAFVAALHKVDPESASVPATGWQLENLIGTYLQELKNQRSLLPAPDLEGLVDTEERTNVVDVDLFAGLGLPGCAVVEAENMTSDRQLALMILRERGPYVAVVTSRSRLKFLADREAMLDAVARDYARTAEHG